MKECLDVSRALLHAIRCIPFIAFDQLLCRSRIAALPASEVETMCLPDPDIMSCVEIYVTAPAERIMATRLNFACGRCQPRHPSVFVLVLLTMPPGRVVKSRGMPTSPKNLTVKRCAEAADVQLLHASVEAVGLPQHYQSLGYKVGAHHFVLFTAISRP